MQHKGKKIFSELSTFFKNNYYCLLYIFIIMEVKHLNMGKPLFLNFIIKY